MESRYEERDGPTPLSTRGINHIVTTGRIATVVQRRGQRSQLMAL